MGNWRPEEKDWIKIKREHCKTVTRKADCKHCPTKPMVCNKSFEAGADAMLEALWKMARESPTKSFTLDAVVISALGS